MENIFQTQSLLIDKVLKNKFGLELLKNHSSSYKKKFRKIPLLVIFYLIKFDDVI